MKLRSPAHWRERGAALLTAMLTVALVATFAAAALWQQWRSIEVETAERARVQSDWILTGALDWARLLLREDAMAGGADHLGEPWAVPLQEARLSSFLAADRNVSTDAGPEVLDAFLSGQIIDMHSLLNVNNLVQAADGKVSPAGVETFARLFALLDLPAEQLEQLAANMQLAREGARTGSGAAPLVPQWVDQLVWLGLTPQTLAVLRPYVTILPGDATWVNLNTASAEVIYASAPALSMAQAQQLVSARERSHFRSRNEAVAVLGGDPKLMAEGQANVEARSRYFEIRSRLRLDQLVVDERALLDRQSSQVIRVVQRERGIPPPAVPQAANNR